MSASPSTRPGAPRTPPLPRASTPLRSRLRRAWQRLHWSSIALQAVLLLALGGLLAAWISIPDSTSTEIFLTVLLALAGPAALLWAQTSLWRRIALRHNASATLRSVLFTLGCFLIFWFVDLLLSAFAVVTLLHTSSPLLQTTLSVLVALLLWATLAFLALLLFTAAVTAAAAESFSLPAIRRTTARLLRTPGFWPPLALAAALATIASELTLSWHPATTEAAAQLTGYLKVGALWLVLSLLLTLACSWISTFLREL